MSVQSQKRVLLTTVHRPFTDPSEGKTVGSELFHRQLTLAQGVFSVRQQLRGWGLDYIAVNLDVPATVLHYPTLKQLKRELQRYNYTHVGIHFVVSTTERMKKVSALVRQYLPRAQIILGGYGTVLPDEILQPHGDHFCRGEGIAFMRNLLSEDESQPIRHPYAPVRTGSILSIRDSEMVSHITSGLGCSNACDFCCTSHFFSRKFHHLITCGKEVYHQLREQYRKAEARGQTVGHTSVIDEDFFFNEERTRDYLEAIRNDPFSFSIHGFGSIRSLSRYTAKEVAEMGFDVLWIGLEGKDAGFGKLKGVDPHQYVQELKQYGVCVLGSSIIGLPYQDKDIIREEFEQVIKMELAFSQFAIYFAFPGTPLFKRMTKNHRFNEQYKNFKNLKRWDAFSQQLMHDQFEDGELEKIQMQLYAEENRRLGPSIFRLCDTWLTAIPNLEKSGEKVLELRAQRLRGIVKKIRPIIPLGIWLGQSPEVRNRLKELDRKFTQVMGKWSLTDRLAVGATPLLGVWTWLKNKLYPDSTTEFIRVENHEL